MRRRRLLDLDRLVMAPTISDADIDLFVRAFSSLPPSEKSAILQRILNLLPDKNVALLKGLLFDRSQPKEVVRPIFNDIINRPEEVKKPIVEAILKDKTHPCYSDAEWIYEVTGEKVGE